MSTATTSITTTDNIYNNLREQESTRVSVQRLMACFVDQNNVPLTKTTIAKSLYKMYPSVCITKNHRNISNMIHNWNKSFNQIQQVLDNNELLRCNDPTCIQKDKFHRVCSRKEGNKKNNVYWLHSNVFTTSQSSMRYKLRQLKRNGMMKKPSPKIYKTIREPDSPIEPNNLLFNNLFNNDSESNYYTNNYEPYDFQLFNDYIETGQNYSLFDEHVVCDDDDNDLFTVCHDHDTESQIISPTDFIQDMGVDNSCLDDDIFKYISFQ